MKDGLLIDDLLTISLADYHRLPQQPIIKLTNSTDKKLIFTKLKNLKKYNEIRKSFNKKPHILPSICPNSFNKNAKLCFLNLKRPSV